LVAKVEISIKVKLRGAGNDLGFLLASDSFATSTRQFRAGLDEITGIALDIACSDWFTPPPFEKRRERAER
jgi:hypothetical protein